MTPPRGLLRRLTRGLSDASYVAVQGGLRPVHRLLARVLRPRARPGSVLHISYPVHTAWHTVEALRAGGIDAEYLALGQDPLWTRYDHGYVPPRLGALRALAEARLVWTLMVRFEVLHLHFGITPTVTGWELPLLRAMGRKVVFHWRGCEVRDPAALQARRPDVNICQECDYSPRLCEWPSSRQRRALARLHADLTLVTTPDLLQFAPRARHVPFFLPGALPSPPAPRPSGGPLRVLHATNQPGIEGSAHIVATVERLRARGLPIELEYLRGAPSSAVLEALTRADVSVGKLKMGYYANFQVESLGLGVPAITHVWPELRTPELEASGLIFASLPELEATLERLLREPALLEASRRVARASAGRLHGAEGVTRRYAALYAELTGREVPSWSS